MPDTLHQVAYGAGRQLVILHSGTLDHRQMAKMREPVLEERPGW